MVHFEHFTHLTFDCYGTLIDWETGILTAVMPVLARRGIAAEAEQLLQLYVKYEAEQEAGPYKPYRDVLQGVIAGIGGELGFVPTAAELRALPGSVGHWPPFADTVAALRRLQTRYKLVIISGTFQIPVDSFQETSGKTRAVAAKTVNYFCPILKGASFPILMM